MMQLMCIYILDHDPVTRLPEIVTSLQSIVSATLQSGRYDPSRPQ